MTARIICLLFMWVLVCPSASIGQSAAQSFDSNGVRIQYVDRGRGAPVILIHGFTGSYARHFEAPGIIDALETAGYRAIAMDCRGHGQSGKPHDPSQYGFEMVGDLTRLLDHLNIERAHVVGYSMGGAIASQLLVKDPRRLLSLTLLGAGWEGEDLSVIGSLFKEIATSFAKGDASPLIRRLTANGQVGPTDEEVKALSAALFARNDAQALAATARGLTPLYELPRAALGATTVPVLAIIGELDENREAAKRMASVVPGMKIVEIAGATHASSVRPSAEPLVAFLNQHRD